MISPLLQLILNRIRNSGPLTVAGFVDEALYHEGLGYYARAGQRSGRAGDFITSVDVGPVFGELLSVAFAEMWSILSKDAGPGAADRFDLVEAAAGNGRLARDVLDAAAARRPAFYRAARLHLVERSPRARAEQTAVLGPHLPRLAASSATLPTGVDGVIYANELLDALPPHLVVMREDALREVYVDADGDRLVTREGPVSSTRIPEYLDRVGARLQPGWFAEVNLAAADWVREAGHALARGFLVLIDYGREASTLYSASHATGTLTTYRRHAAEHREQGPGWLLEPGDRDITSHVDLTGLSNAAGDAGLERLGIVDQTYFLLGLAERATRDGTASPDNPRRRLALKTLLMPGGMGSTLKVAIFAKGVDAGRAQGLCYGGRLT
jgi:SAM-dependent MidA family methyltransferase